MSAREGHQPLISQWVRRPLGTRSSLVVNSNGINIKKKAGLSVISKVDKSMISTVVQNENIDISVLCNIVKVSPRKVVLNTSSQDIHRSRCYQRQHLKVYLMPAEIIPKVSLGLET